MHSNPLFPRIIEDYKTHLRSVCDSPLSFQSFCSTYSVAMKSLRQWMRRHGLSVSTLRYEILLEQNGTALDSFLQSTYREKKCTIAVLSKKSSSGELPASEQIKGATVTFPDGVVVSIRQTSACALTKFIESYHLINDKRHV